MKVHIPFSPAGDIAPDLPIMGYGQLPDHTGRNFRLMFDEKHSRLVLACDGRSLQVKYLDVIEAFKHEPLDTVEHEPGRAAVPFSREERANAPALHALCELDGYVLARAVNGWAVVWAPPSKKNINLGVFDLVQALMDAPMPEESPRGGESNGAAATSAPTASVADAPAQPGDTEGPVPPDAVHFAALQQLAHDLQAYRDAAGMWSLPFFGPGGAEEWLPLPRWLERRRKAADELYALEVLCRAQAAELDRRKDTQKGT